MIEPKERLGTGSLGVRIFQPKPNVESVDNRFATTDESSRGGKGRPKSNGEIKARERGSEGEVVRTGGSVSTTTASDQLVVTRHIEDSKQEYGQNGPVSEQGQGAKRGFDSAVAGDGEEASRKKTLALSERLLELQKRSGRDPLKSGRVKEQPPVRPPQRVWRKERVSASAPKLEDGSGRQLTLVEERALVNVFARRLRALPSGSGLDAVTPLVKDLRLPLTPFRANLVLKQLGDVRDWERALLLVKWMEGHAEHPPRTDTYAKLFSILSEAGEYSKIVDCYHSLKRQDTVQPDYQNLLRILGQGGCLQAALEVLDDLKSRGIRPDLSAYNHAINAAAPGGAYVEAERLLEELQTAGLAPNSVTYGTIIEVMGQGGRWEDAVGYFERYLEGGFEPTVVTYKNLLLALAIGGQAESAEKYLGEMRSRGLVPSGACYSAVACAHAAAGDWRRGVEVIKGMPPDVDGKRSPVITYTALIQSLDRVGRPQEGLEVLEFMKLEKGCTPNAVTYATLAGSLARHGEIEKAENVLREMRQRGFKPDVRTWGLLLTACAQQALHQRIRQLLLDMKRSGCDPDVGCFESLVLAYANGGRVREGLELLRGLRAKGLAVRQSAYVPLLGACAKARDVVSAKEVWADLNAHLDNLPTSRLCTAFMEALISGGAHEEALSVFRRMEDLGTEPDFHAYALAIEAYGCADTEGFGFGEGSWEGFSDEEEFDFGEESVSYGSRKRPGASTEFKTEAVEIRRGTRGELSRSTEAESNGGRTVSGKSGRGLGEVEREGAESSRLHVDPGPDKDPLLDTREQDSFANLEIGPRVRGLGGGLDGGSGAQANDVEEGLSGKEDIEGSAEVSLTHGARKVAESRSAPRAFTRANQLYLELLEKRRPLSRSVFIAVLKVCRKHGEIREALEVPDQMVAAGVKPDTRVYNVLLEVCSAVGNWAAGVRVKQRMVSEGVKANGYTHDIWIRLAGRCRKVDEAVFAFEEMQRLGLKRTLVTWNALIGALGAGGRWQEALGRFRGLPEGMTPSVVTYDVVIRLLARAGRVDEALGVLGEMRGAGFEPRVQLYDVVARALFEQKRWVSFVELMETVEKQGLLSNSGLRERARRVERRLRQQGWRNGSLEQRGKEGVKVTDSLFRRENLSRAGEEDTASSVEGGAAFTDVDFSFGEGRGTDWAVGELEGEPHLDGEKATVLSVQELKGGAAFGTNAGVSYGGEEEGQNIRVEAGESARLQEPGADDEGHRRGGHSPGSSRSARCSNGPDGLSSDPVASAQVESVAGFGKEASPRNDQREKDASREKDPERDDRDRLRRGVDWDSIAGVPPREPRTVRPKVRRRAKIVAPKTEEWVRYTGRATGQDLVKLLGGHFDESMPSRGQAQKEQRHIVAFRNREVGSSSQESNV